MATYRLYGEIIGKNQHGNWVIRAHGEKWYVDFGPENNKICQCHDWVRFEHIVDDKGKRSVKFIENVTAKNRQKPEKKKELVVIDHIHKDTGLVDIYLPSRDEHDSSFVRNWSWQGVKIDGLDLNSCGVKDQLLVAIETVGKKRTITFIKNASRDIGEYTNIVVGKLRITPDGLCSVNAIVGGKVFYNVDLGAYKDICRAGDLVEIRVYYDKGDTPVRCELIKNTSAVARGVSGAAKEMVKG